MNASLGYIPLGLNITHYLHNLKIKEISWSFYYAPVQKARNLKSRLYYLNLSPKDKVGSQQYNNEVSSPQQKLNPFYESICPKKIHT